ncbi:hypothetical protein EV424DRAFT_1426197 [Suillus variegatus]|nr:hypothetical protein EV424DRAFT_1426197 [Suillus variegatus]
MQQFSNNASDEGIHLQCVVLELCSLGNQRRPRILLDECIQCRHEAVFLCSERHPERETYLNSLALSLDYRSDHQGNSHDLNEAISLYEETLCRAGHRSRDPLLNNPGLILLDRFNQRGDIYDLMRAISLHW